MAQEIFAPWAELVPDAPPKMTIDELLRLPQDEWMYELVDGRLVRMPLSGGEASHIALRLASALFAFVDDRGLGRVTGADGEFDLTQPGDEGETALAPDAAFVRAEHVPPKDSPEYRRAWHVAPDIAAEIVSPSQFRPEMEFKARRYLAAGVRLVWLVWPKSQQVDVWRPSADQPIVTLTIADALDGLDVLPGFSYPLARLFS